MKTADDNMIFGRRSDRQDTVARAIGDFYICQRKRDNKGKHQQVEYKPANTPSIVLVISHRNVNVNEKFPDVNEYFSEKDNTTVNYTKMTQSPNFFDPKAKRSSGETQHHTTGDKVGSFTFLSSFAA